MSKDDLEVQIAKLKADKEELLNCTTGMALCMKKLQGLAGLEDEDSFEIADKVCRFMETTKVTDRNFNKKFNEMNSIWETL